AALVDALARDAVESFRDRADAPAVRLAPRDRAWDEGWAVGPRQGAAQVVADRPAADLLGWLLGRTDPAALDLPPLPPWL
ncbi:hypothetical protein GT354_42750, partial [Streptomyces sp. SID3343]|nr:hypothetical protein [Streptomyces sp. SID3343]